MSSQRGTRGGRPPGPPSALVIVRNAVDHDSRVLRAARTSRDTGFRTEILGVVSWTERREASDHRGIPIRRIAPSSRLAWAVYRRISFLSPGSRRQDAEAPQRGASEGARGGLPAGRGGARRLLRWAATLAYYRRAIGVVRALKPQLVHCNDYNTMWIGVAARLLAGSVVIYDSHELWPDRNLRPEPRWWLLLCEALFVRIADRVVTTSPAYAEVMSRRYRVPEPLVIRNIPEAGLEVPPAPRPTRPDGSPVAIYVGGLQPNRGLEPAIKAVAMAPGVRLRLLGPSLPDYKRSLEELVGRLRIEDRVEFAPPVAPAEVLEALVGADAGLALIQPADLSYRLTLPNKLFEYTLAGLPILGSDLPMIAKFIDGYGLGATVDPDDVDAIAIKLQQLLEPARNERHREAAARAAEALDGKRELESLAGVYREGMARAGRTAALGRAPDTSI